MTVLEILFVLEVICHEEEFNKLDNFNKLGFILGCENWDKYDFIGAG